MVETIERPIRTTLVINSEDRELIKGSGKTISDFFTELLNLYKNMTIDNWTDGSYIIGFDRYCLINKTCLNQILNNFKTDKKVGEIIGRIPGGA